ncbi:hypothetical protein BOX15_Mlig021476g1 [Macrostomum lignano]|uniref:Uncharacterized protein n=1 Tax=Macrostomum lignano TaxID=282301 RepID=A0A267FGL3_9PLAT|nr:hypothetical protein BOX15_Mlig021476g1 [Macrostomum lignano]
MRSPSVLHRDSNYLDDFGCYFDNDGVENGVGSGGQGSGGGKDAGCLVRCVCALGDGCLALAGLLAALLPLLLPAEAPACCYGCLQPLVSAAGLGLTAGAAGLALTAGLAGLAASVASRRARVGHAVAAVLTVCCALLAANAGVLLAKEERLADQLLTACGGADWRAALGISAAGALILLAKSGLNWTCYYKYSRASVYDGQYNLAKLRRQRWRRLRLQQRHRQQRLQEPFRRDRRPRGGNRLQEFELTM